MELGLPTGLFGRVSYDDPAERAAYVAGVAEAIDAVAIHVEARSARELEEWLRELREWTGGEPPLAPHRWEC